MKIFFKKIKLINKYFKLFLISISLILFIFFTDFFIHYNLNDISLNKNFLLTKEEEELKLKDLYDEITDLLNKNELEFKNLIIKAKKNPKTADEILELNLIDDVSHDDFSHDGSLKDNLTIEKLKLIKDWIKDWINILEKIKEISIWLTKKENELKWEDEYLGIKFLDTFQEEHFSKEIQLELEENNDDWKFDINDWYSKHKNKKENDFWNYWIEDFKKKFQKQLDRKKYQELFDSKKNLIELAFSEKYLLLKFHNLNKFFNNKGKFKNEKYNNYIKKIDEKKSKIFFNELKKLFEKDEFKDEENFKLKEKKMKKKKISKILIYTFSFILFFSLVSLFVYKKISKKFTKKIKNNEN